MSIGERIQLLRKERNVSQAQLAQIMNVSRQAVSKWENDMTAPDMIKLIQLADVLDTDVEYLATGVHSRLISPPQVVTVVEKVDNIVEKIVEKPVVVEKTVEVEKIVEVEKRVETVVEKPVIRRVVRRQYLRNPIEFLLTGIGGFLLGLLIGCFLL